MRTVQTLSTVRVVCSVLRLARCDCRWAYRVAQHLVYRSISVQYHPVYLVCLLPGLSVSLCTLSPSLLSLPVTWSICQSMYNITRSTTACYLVYLSIYVQYYPVYLVCLLPGLSFNLCTISPVYLICLLPGLSVSLCTISPSLLSLPVTWSICRSIYVQYQPVYFCLLPDLSVNLCAISSSLLLPVTWSICQSMCKITQSTSACYLVYLSIYVQYHPVYFCLLPGLSVGQSMYNITRLLNLPVTWSIYLQYYPANLVCL